MASLCEGRVIELADGEERCFASECLGERRRLGLAKRSHPAARRAMQDKAAGYRQEATKLRAVARQISWLRERQDILDDADRLDALAAVEEGRTRQRWASVSRSQEANAPLLQRAQAAIEEARRLMEAQQQIRAKVLRQLDHMKRIESVLDPLLSHPPWELAAVRALLAEGGDSQET